MKLAASYLLGHPNWHCPDPGLCPQCEGKSRQLSTLYSAPLPANTPRGPSPDSSPPGMTPLQPKCSPNSSTAPSPPILRASPPPPRAVVSLLHPPLLPHNLFAWVRHLYPLPYKPVVHQFHPGLSSGISGVPFWYSPLVFVSFLCDLNVRWRGNNNLRVDVMR